MSEADEDVQPEESWASARALLEETSERVTQVHVGGHHLTVDAPPFPAGSSAGPNPLGLLMAAIAADTALTCRAYTNRKYTYPGAIEVTVSCTRANLREAHQLVAIERELDEHERATLAMLIERSPISALLGPGMTIRTKFQLGHSA